MKVLLISSNTNTAPYPVYPLGLDYVAGAIKDRHQVKIVDMNQEDDLFVLEDVIKSFCPDIVGLSIRNIDNTDITEPVDFLQEYRNIARRIRKTSRALLLLGGSGFSIFPTEVLHLLGADYGLVGEGERLAELLDLLESNKEIREVPGLVQPDSNTYPPRPFQGRIQRQFNPAENHVQYYLDRGGMLNLQTKRGCPFKCIYCTYPYIEGNHLRLLSPESLAKQAIQLQNAGAQYLYLADSSFNADYRHSAEVAKAFKETGLKLPWGGFFTPSRPPKGYYEALASAGLSHVEFGTDSLSDRMLRSYQKPFSVKDVLKAHQSATQAGLYTAHYFLLGGPGENRETVQETLSNIDSLENTVLFFFCGIRIYPHTKLYSMYSTPMHPADKDNLLYPAFYESEQISSREITETISQKAQNRPNWVISSGGQPTAALLKKMYNKGYSGPLWEYLIR